MISHIGKPLAGADGEDGPAEHYKTGKLVSPGLFPMSTIALSFAAGILLQSQAGFPSLLPVLLIPACALVALVSSGITSRGFLLCAFAAAGALSFQAVAEPHSADRLRTKLEDGGISSGDPVEISGTVSGGSLISIDGYRFDLDVGSLVYKERRMKAGGRVRVYVRRGRRGQAKEPGMPGHGALLRVGGRIFREERYRNPGGFSYREFLDRADIAATVSVKSALLIEEVCCPSGNRLAMAVIDLRMLLQNAVVSRFEPRTAGVILATALGNRLALTKDAGEAFRNGGTFHLLVVSGLHVTFAGGIVLLLISGLTGSRITRFIVTNFAIWIYAFFVGGGIPVIRAALMFTTIHSSFAIHRKNIAINTLGLCALVVLVYDPRDLFDPSFHLSFGSVAAIAAFAIPILERIKKTGAWFPSPEHPFPPEVASPVRAFCEALYWDTALWERMQDRTVWDCRLFKSRLPLYLRRWRLQRPIRTVFEAVVVSVSVHLFLLPFMTVYFHRITPGSMLFSLPAGILIVVENAFALLSLAAAMFSESAGAAFAALTEAINGAHVATQGYVSGTALHPIRVPVYSGYLRLIYILYFLPLLYLVRNLNIVRSPMRGAAISDSKNGPHKRAAIAVLILIIANAVIVFHPWSRPTGRGRLSVSFLDVGQGDAAFIEFPNGETMLLDGGGETGRSLYGNTGTAIPQPVRDYRGVGEAVVAEYLWEKGYSSVDYLVLSHPDSDHLRGLIEIARLFRVKRAFIGKNTGGDLSHEFIDTLRKERIPVYSIYAGDSMRIGDALIEISNPPRAGTGSQTRNNDSVMLRLIYGAKKFLFTGDIESETELRLAKISARVRADVVKVPHHGSRTSSSQTFVNAVSPVAAVIPVGKRSQFGHPHKEVIERWSSSGARIFQTGARGTVTVSTDGSDLVIKTYVR